MSGGGREARGERLMGKEGLKIKELKVWQKGKDLAVYIYQITNIKFKYALKFKINIGTVENLLPLTISP